MYQPDQLTALINQARLNGHKAILQALQSAQSEMTIANLIETSSDYVKLGWRDKCNDVTSLEELGL